MDIRFPSIMPNSACVQLRDGKALRLINRSAVTLSAYHTRQISMIVRDYHARQQIDAIWDENSEHVLRLVCVHPDEPTLQAKSVLLIRDGEIEQVEVGGELDWLETRKRLN